MYEKCKKNDFFYSWHPELIYLPEHLRRHDLSAVK